VQAVYQVQSDSRSASIPVAFATSGTTSFLYLGTNPVDSAWGRFGYQKALLLLAARVTGDDTSTTATSGRVTNVTPNQYQIRTFPIRFDGLSSDFLNSSTPPSNALQPIAPL
jgi:hypothetical protein